MDSPSGFQGLAAAAAAPLATKPASASRVVATLPFSRDADLRMIYVNYFGDLRVGKILEDLDLIAGEVAFKHAAETITAGSNAGQPITLVTACVDRIVLRDRLDPQRDLRYTGSCTWTGRSSMEIRLAIHSRRPRSTEEEATSGSIPSSSSRSSRGAAAGEDLEPQSRRQEQEEWENNLEASFVFVAKNAATGRSVALPSLQPANADEERLFKAGSEAAAERKRLRSTDLNRVPPRQAENELVHSLLFNFDALVGEPPAGGEEVAVATPELVELRRLVSEACRQPADHSTAACNDAVVQMASTELTNTLIMNPQSRNVHGKVFGGALMREAFELAFITAYRFDGLRGVTPVFVALDDTHFLHPVEIGSFVEFRSKVIFADGPAVHVQVEARVLNPHDQQQWQQQQQQHQESTHKARQQQQQQQQQQQPKTTNVFNFLMHCRDNRRIVVPRTYAEAMEWLQGWRYHREHQDGHQDSC